MIRARASKQPTALTMCLSCLALCVIFEVFLHIIRSGDDIRYVYDTPDEMFAIGFWKKYGEDVDRVARNGVNKVRIRLWIYVHGTHEVWPIYGCTYSNGAQSKEFWHFASGTMIDPDLVDKIKLRVISSEDGAIFGVVEAANPDVLLLSYDSVKNVQYCGEVGNQDLQPGGTIDTLSKASNTPGLMYYEDVSMERRETLPLVLP